MEPVDRHHIVGFVLDLAFEGLQHDMRQVDADDVEAIGRHAVDLRPHQAAAGAGFVLDDGFDAGAAFFQHQLLVARGNVGFAAGGEGLPVADVFLGAALRGSGS